MCLLAAAAVFLTGIDWGLPSRAADAYLFGDRRPRTGAEIQRSPAAGRRRRRAGRRTWTSTRATGGRRSSSTATTPSARPEIVRRYRLYSHQPDEMNTLMALASMRPGAFDLDPKMYKYGGLWVYPVGGC